VCERVCECVCVCVCVCEHVCVCVCECVHVFKLLKQPSVFCHLCEEVTFLPPTFLCVCVRPEPSAFSFWISPFSVFHSTPCSFPSHRYQCHMTVAVRRPKLGAMTHSQQQKHINTTWRAAIRLPPGPTSQHKQHSTHRTGPCVFNTLQSPAASSYGLVPYLCITMNNVFMDPKL